MIDQLDTQILHALQCSPRASFRRIAAVVGVSEQTVARRYQGLRRDGVLRVLARITSASRGKTEWVARIRCRPDRVTTLADALVRRPDISFAHITSGGAEIVCLIRSEADTLGDDVLLQQLPRTVSVLDVSIDLLLHRFGPGPTADWTGYAGRLDDDQVQALLDDRTHPSGPPIEPTQEDLPLLAALAHDGRTSHTQLAQATGWTKSRVARRLDSLESSGTLYYDVDLLPERLGYRLHATLWLRVAPHHLQAVGEELARHEEIAVALAVSGRANIMALVICRDPDALYHYLTTRIASVQAIDGYEVSIRVRALKQADSIIAYGRLVPPPS